MRSVLSHIVLVLWAVTAIHAQRAASPTPTRDGPAIAATSTFSALASLSIPAGETAQETVPVLHNLLRNVTASEYFLFGVDHCRGIVAHVAMPELPVSADVSWQTLAVQGSFTTWHLGTVVSADPPLNITALTVQATHDTEHARALQQELPHNNYPAEADRNESISELRVFRNVPLSIAHPRYWGEAPTFRLEKRGCSVHLFISRANVAGRYSVYTTDDNHLWMRSACGLALANEVGTTDEAAAWTAEAPMLEITIYKALGASVYKDTFVGILFRPSDERRPGEVFWQHSIVVEHDAEECTLRPRPSLTDEGGFQQTYEVIKESDATIPTLASICAVLIIVLAVSTFFFRRKLKRLDADYGLVHNNLQQMSQMT